MRFLIIFITLSVPQLAYAQLFKSVEIGSYVLSANPHVRQLGGLYLRSSEQLIVRDLAGKNTSFSPQQVSSFKIRNCQFVSTGGFQLRSGFGDSYIAQAFAEQLDSGQVVLMRYQPLSSKAATGGYIGYDDQTKKSVYLLRSANTFTVTPIQSSWSRKSTPFHEALRPYLAARNDLIQLLETNQLAPQQLPSIVYALNHNLPFDKAAEHDVTR